MSELGEEKIDIIEWAENIEDFVANALGPAQVESVSVDAEVAKVKVTDEQLSLAIGKDGQNVRLAAKLTGLKIDITSPSLDSKVSSDRKEGEGEEKEISGTAAIAETMLSSRTLTALEKAEIDPEDLLEMSEEDILDISGIGKASMEEISEFKEKIEEVTDSEKSEDSEKEKDNNKEDDNDEEIEDNDEGGDDDKDDEEDDEENDEESEE
jgi:N utilization substance protein A